MSEQLDTLRNLIQSARKGNAAAMDLLRSIVRASANEAPSNDLIRIAQFLYELGVEAETSVEQN